MIYKLTKNKSNGQDVEKGVAIMNIPVMISLKAKKANFWNVVTQYFRNVKAVNTEVIITPRDLKNIAIEGEGKLTSNT